LDLLIIVDCGKFDAMSTIVLTHCVYPPYIQMYRIFGFIGLGFYSGKVYYYVDVGEEVFEKKVNFNKKNIPPY